MRCLCSFDTGFHCMILASLELRTLASPLNVGIKSMSPQTHPKTCAIMPSKDNDCLSALYSLMVSVCASYLQEGSTPDWFQLSKKSCHWA